MRRSTVRLIASRETRDLLRDRRTLLLILVLPAILPGVRRRRLAFAISLLGQQPSSASSGPNTPRRRPRTRSPPDRRTLPAIAARRDDPALSDGQFSRLVPEGRAAALVVKILPSADRGPLDAREVDAILIIPPDTWPDRQPTKPGLRSSAGTGTRPPSWPSTGLRWSSNWREKVKRIRFARQGCPD